MQKDAFFQKLERHVAGLFEEVQQKAAASGEKYAHTPHTNELFPVHDGFLIQYFERLVCRALKTRESFRQTAPHWAPELPLNPAEWEKMFRSKDAKIAVVGYYGRSLACADWGAHLSFRDYVCGLLAYEHAPPCIRTDPGLLTEFSPNPSLQGFDKSLVWGVHPRIIEFTQQLMRAEEIWYSCGLADEAKRMCDAIEQLMKLGRDFSDFQPPR